MIHPITPSDLREDILREIVYPDLERTYYWTDLWDPVFYIALARAGFISISHQDAELGTLLIPELQDRYAVLDWKNLHLSNQIQKRMRSKSFTEEEIELRVVRDPQRALDRILAYHGHSSTWLTEPYLELLAQISNIGEGGFSLYGVELWSKKRDLLVAGELGYSIGRTYTSLSGFCTRDDPKWTGFGTLQMVLLARRLEERGFAFWNMGHPKQPYKRALGARLLDRATFLDRWLSARDERPERKLI